MIQAIDLAALVARQLQLKKSQVETVISLLDEGNTIPFIARYRKEMTGTLDENQLRDIEERAQSIKNLHHRKEEVFRLIDEQGRMTPELHQSIEQAQTLTTLEDLYRPYRPKRKTRASVARELGLEPLARWMLEDGHGDLQEQASLYITDQFVAIEDVLQGARDIIAEEVADDAQTRQWVREWTLKKGSLTSEAKDKNASSVYESYYEHREPLGKLPPHRILAINRGEKEEILKVRVDPPIDEIIQHLNRMHVDGKRPAQRHPAVTEQVRLAVEEGYRRLIMPAVEREIRGLLTEQAEQQAIHVFAANLRQLLLQPPVRNQVVMGVDPAYRTGCKIAVVDATGKVLDITVVYPTPPQSKVEESKRVLIQLIRKHVVQAIAIGNGTASRETELFVAEMLREIPENVVYTMVSEAGASVYSASKLAGEEFPALDVSERSAISIARRLQDPLAELVKIDPKSIGVGQYQHDVSQKQLNDQLGFVVETTVNQVGVDINTASPSLLAYVAGLSPAVAKSVVAYREKNGAFQKRTEIDKVPRLGPKTRQQAIGFLRIPGGVYPLDNTPIHPESYVVAEKLLDIVGFSLSDIKEGAPLERKQELLQALQNIDYTDMSERLDVGIPTLTDIVDALKKPGRDPREELEAPVFRTDVLRIEDLQIDMVLKGTVRNVVDFGAFVDIGLKNDGLIHISELADRFVKHPLDVVAVGDVVDVRVISVDLNKGRVGLSRKGV